MAQRVATYTWGDVMSIVQRKVSRSLHDDMGTFIANQTLNWIWDKYDWRESLSTLPPFYLIPSEQDYGAPAVSIPSDFWGLRWANLVRSTIIPPYRSPLAIIKDLQPTHIRYLPHAIGYVTDKKVFRLYPRIPDNIGSPDYMIEGQYKNRPTKLTTSTLTTTLLPFDDVYVDVWIETAKWVSYRMDGDPRAGNITYANGQLTSTGQAAVMMEMIDWMASSEGLELGDPVIAPAEPLVSGLGYRPSFFGIGLVYG